MRWEPATALLAAVALFSAHAQSQSPALAQANAALQAGEADKALNLLAAMPESGPEQAQALNLLCRVRFSLEQWDAAANACEKAVNLDGQNSNYHLWLGRALGERAGRASFLAAFSLAKRTRAEFEEAVRLNPANVEALSTLGEFYRQAPGVVGGGIDKAEDVAARLDKLDPGRAHQLHGNIAEQKKDYSAAEREFKLAIATGAHPAIAWTNLAGFYARRQRFTEMETAMHSAISAALKDRHAGVALYDGAGLLTESNRDPALAQTQDAYIPNLAIASTIGYSHGFPTGQPSVGSASMQSLVFSYSQRQYLKAAKAGVEAANLSLKDAREQVALETSTTYIELDTVTRELAAASQQEAFTAQLVRIEQERNQAGVDSSMDLLQARLTAANLKLQRLHLETRAATLAKQIAVLTALPVGSILPDHASIPEIPQVSADQAPRSLPGTDSALSLARSKELQAKGDDLAWRRPQIGFGSTYNYDINEFNNYEQFYQPHTFTPNNVSFGLQISVPFFDFSLRAKARATAAEALRARVEAEQAQRQNDVQIATLTGSLRELDAQAEVASLKQQIADEQLKAVLAQLEVGNGASAGPNAQPQATPKQEQLARIDERQKYLAAQDAAFDLAKARLSLLRALGHMEDWLNQLHQK